MQEKVMKKEKKEFTPLTITLLVVLILFCISLFYLLAWVVVTSFKVNDQIFGVDPGGFIINYNRYYKVLSTTGTSKDILVNIANFNKAKEEGMLLYSFRHILNDFTMPRRELFGYVGKDTATILEMYGFSFLYAGGCAITATVVPCIVAYACARFPYKFSKWIYTTVIVVMMIPIVGSMPSEIQMAKNLGIMNKIWGLWIMKANFLGLYFLVFYDIFKALPVSFTEAAKIDGANNFQILVRIALPLIKNTFFTVLLIKFIAFWNDYQSPQVYMPSYPTISKGLHRLMTISGDPGKVHTQIPARMAAVILTAAPVTVLFIIFQKRLLGNLTMGGVKG